mgnify:FL=1
MKENEIKKKYKKKINQLIKHNQLYFEKNKPNISDADYDKLKKEIFELEINYKYLKDKNSPRFSVGFTPSKNFKKKKHRIPMLSLSNTFDRDDLKNFEKKIFNFLNIKNNIDFEYSVEPKIDGISASLTYLNGKLIYGLSRGNGKEGEVITDNLKTISDIPHEVTDADFPEDIDIRGEVFIKNNDFQKIENKFANPRNAASGSLRQKNPEEVKKIPLNFIAYTYGYFKNNKFKKQSELIKSLKKWGFKTSEYNSIIKGADNLIKNHEKFEKDRFKLNYDVDGLVYKLNDFSLQERLGFAANSPRWATAHKFSAQNTFSKVLDITVQVGRTGALTPVAKIKPVNVGGVIVSNATLHNEDEIKRKDIRVGDTVKIERAGDVIPHVISVDLAKRNKQSKKYFFPNQCPSCGSKIIKEYNSQTKKYDAVKRCTSEGYICEKIAIEKIKHFVSKEALNIDGLGKKVVEKFWDLKLIRLPQHIFDLDYEKIKKLDGWGKLSVSNLKYAIDKSKKITLDKFIFSLGIRHIGKENAKLISYYIKNIQNLSIISSNYNFDNFLNIDGIGETQINSLKKFFSNKTNTEVIKKLSKFIDIINDDINLDGKLNNKTFMITGKLSGVSRAEIKSLIEKNSGKILSSVSKRLNYLIVGNKPTTRKVTLAKDLKIQVVNQKEFEKMLN